MILVTGFGPFGELAENPSGALALAVDGCEVRGVPVRGIVLPVSYQRAPCQTADAAAHARLVVGLGVAPTREGVQVECTAVNRCSRDDIDGVCPADLGEGAPSLDVRLDVEALAAALGGTLSRDAGSYVCNAWLYTSLRDLAVPAVFVHVASCQALSPGRLLAGLEVLL
ncbi:MAG TPA: hypothetical protein QGF58_05295 [Myxococcota bacterium]|nr:hypothetical protein [Myxococcota bacterium]